MRLTLLLLLLGASLLPEARAATTEEGTQPTTTGEEETQPLTTREEVTQTPTTGEEETQPPTTGEEETQPPTTREEVTQTPTTGEEETQPPTTPEDGTRPPTTRGEGTRPPTTPEDGTRPPTTPEDGTRPPTTPEDGTRSPTTAERKTPDPTSTATATQSTPTQRPSTAAPTTQGPTSTQRSTTQEPTETPDVEYEVPTAYGTVIGTTYRVVRGFSASSKQTVNERRISKFLGVPYAQAPTGSRRFRPPAELPKSSDAQINATEFKPNCPQSLLKSTAEDCLHYNVWTPRTSENPNSTYPVIVWIHGGRFEVGGSNDGLTEGEEMVTHEDVVVVTFNYRLGALGFLTLKDTDYGGNYGIQDQKLALRVINEVVENFGGDRSKITLMGLDAGSESIGFHMLDTETKNWFSRAIMMGGSPMMPWPLTPETDFVQSVNVQFVSRIGCDQANKEEQRRCLENLDLDDLIRAQRDFNRMFRGLEFSPIIDGSVVRADPWSAFSNGDFDGKDLLLGATNDEGANMVADTLQTGGVQIDALTDEKLLEFILQIIDFYPRSGQRLSDAGRDFLRLHFTNRGGNNVGRTNFKILSDAVGDWFLACSVPQMARFVEAKSNNVFMYYFTEKEILQTDWDGASHGVDAKYAFGIPTKAQGIAYPPEKKRLSERLMGHFVKFANAGVPETDPILWKRLNASGGEMNFINYNADASVLGNKRFGFRAPQCHFWNRTLQFVDGLERRATPPPATTTAAPGTTENATTTATTTTSRPPIGPAASCSWAFTETSGLILGLLLTTQLGTAAALVYFIIKWKRLAKVGNMETVAMT